MNIIDLHCDVLLRMEQSKGELSFEDSVELDVTYNKLKQGGVKIQAFAIFIPPSIKSDQKFQVALDQIHYFYNEVIGKNPKMKALKNWQEFDQLADDEIGAFLTLEGVDCIGNDMQKLSILHELGVRSIGLTWNNANLAADGVGEERGAGLTEFGKEIVRFCNDRQILSDVSHLSERAFWDLLDLAKYPIASHSNSKTLCSHQRNLTDEQATHLFKKNGLIHVVYTPPFITGQDSASISDLIAHIDHFCSLGGVKQIGFGSDFDGISKKITNLEDASMHPALIDELLKKYSEDEVKGFAYQNFLDHRPKQ
ncbi:dipeptidase [Sporosarcina highlanderae]|uniref:Dipeptidase n=1 Tax=Sporosarcina highlanderae TaxID=3035916 RepID=A0ABT8JNP7_9BACL|nr:dipeptidase [Sporosarcina highlanderae]MDN4606577.1 dipeptidase [Sporosarcina highlanderae]